MRNDQPVQQRAWKGGLLASLAIHLLVAAIVLPRSLVTPAKQEQTITVELVKDPNPPAKAKAEPPPPVPPPKPEKPPEETAKMAPPMDTPSAQQGGPHTLNPVVQFGDKDSGPRKSLDGNSAESVATTAPARPDPTRQDLPPTLPATTTAATGQVPLGPSKSTSAPKPKEAAQTQPGRKLDQAKRLFSKEATGDLNAMIAMASMPRGERAAQLCSTELGQQLMHATPAYSPDFYPFDRLQEGTVIDAPNVAFHANSKWYDLSYRCEVNEQATKVVSFAYRVGEPLSPSEMKNRGIPSQ